MVPLHTIPCDMCELKAIRIFPSNKIEIFSFVHFLLFITRYYLSAIFIIFILGHYYTVSIVLII